MKKIKVSELPLYNSLRGLFTLGTDKDNRSVKVSLEFIETTTQEAVKNANDAAAAAQTKTAAAVSSANSAATNANQKASAAETAAQGANAAATSANSAAQAAQTAKTNAETATAQATSAAQAAFEAAQACADAVTVKGHVELQSDGAIASIPIYGDVSVTSDNTVKIELDAREDSLYAKFSRPLEADEYLMLLRRGTNKRGTNRDKTDNKRRHKRSKLRWHLYPAILTIGEGEYEGEIGLDDVSLITGVAKPINQSPTRWVEKELIGRGEYAGVIYKAHDAREIVISGRTKSVKFGLAVYKGKLAGTSWPIDPPLKRISDVVFFYSTASYNEESEVSLSQHYSLDDETI